MITVTLYTRKDCHLCEQAKADLESLQESIRIAWLKSTLTPILLSRRNTWWRSRWSKWDPISLSLPLTNKN